MNGMGRERERKKKRAEENNKEVVVETYISSKVKNT